MRVEQLGRGMRDRRLAGAVEGIEDDGFVGAHLGGEGPAVSRIVHEALDLAAAIQVEDVDVDLVLVLHALGIGEGQRVTRDGLFDRLTDIDDAVMSAQPLFRLLGREQVAHALRARAR